MRGSASKPSSATTIRTEARKPPPSSAAIGLASASSGVPPKAMTCRITSGAPYVRMSENSSARTWVTRALTAETISGNRSVIPPGWMPVPCSVDPPSAQAASIASTLAGSG